MLSEFDQIFAVRRFPPGRAFEAADEVHAFAVSSSREPLADLAKLADEARQEAMRYIEKRARRMAQRIARGEGRTRELDRKVDGNFYTMHSTLEREATDYADEPSGKRAQHLIDKFFPRGLGPITQVAFEEQIIVNEHLIARLVKEHETEFEMLGITREVNRIRGLLPHYRASLKTVETVSPGELGEAYERLQVAMMRMIGWIMVMLRDDTERARAMRPIRAQVERLAAIHSARRRGQAVTDDVPTESLDLDAEARAAVEAAAAAEAELAAEAAGDEGAVGEGDGMGEGGEGG